MCRNRCWSVGQGSRVPQRAPAVEEWPAVWLSQGTGGQGQRGGPAVGRVLF